MFKRKAATVGHKLGSRKGTAHEVSCIRLLQVELAGEKTGTSWIITMHIKTQKFLRSQKDHRFTSHLQPLPSLIFNIPE